MNKTLKLIPQIFLNIKRNVRRPYICSRNKWIWSFWIKQLTIETAKYQIGINRGGVTHLFKIILIRILWEIDCLNAESIAFLICSGLSTLVTLLLPAESVGLTIKGKEKFLAPWKASSGSEKETDLGALKWLSRRNWRNWSLCCRISTDLLGQPGNPSCSATQAQVVTPGSVASDIIPSMIFFLAASNTTARSIMLTSKYSSKNLWAIFSGR